MGNALVCCPPATTVKVYHGDSGHLLKFSCRPIPSTKLMRQHPNYLLVYSVVQVVQTAAAAEGRVPQYQAHIRAVQPGELLELGQTYFLVYTPNQHRRAFATYFIFSRRSSSSTPASPPHSQARSTQSIQNPTSFPLSRDASSLHSPARDIHWTRNPASSPRSRNASHVYNSPTGTPRPIRRNRRLSPRIFSRPPITAIPRSPLAPFLPMATLCPERSGSIPEMARQSIYIPSPQRGSPRGTTRAANEQHPPVNSEQANRVPSPGGLSSPRQETYERIISRNLRQHRNTLANMINEDIQRCPSPVMESPDRAIPSSLSMGSPESEIPTSPSMESPERAIPPQPQVQGTRKSIRNHNLQQRKPANILMRSPGRPIAGPQGSLRNILYRNLHQRSPLMQQIPATSTRNFNQHPRDYSPYHLNKKPA